jgi:CheY-like chemotaxis protein
MSVRILLLDDHSAVRAGIGAIVAAAPDLDLAGAAGSEQELWPLLRATHPDVVLLDLHHPGRDGLTVRTVAGAPHQLLRISLRMRHEAAARLDPEDRPILALRLAGYPPREIGEALRLPVRAVRDRLGAIIAGLEPIRTAQ